MKSRLAILSMLVTGMLLSTAGAGLAVSGVTGDASREQYTTSTPPSGNVLGESDQNSGDQAGQGEQGVAGEQAGSSVQPARQVEAGANSGSLPFTGFLAIPVLLGGVALLSAGLILRKRAADDRS